MDQKELISKIAKELQVISDISPMDWLTLKPYFEYAYGVGIDTGKAMLSHRKKVEQLKDGKSIKIHDSMADAARAVHGDASTICAIVNNKSGCHTHKGFEWKLVTK